MQKEEGMCPLKLLLLALIATRLLIFSHVVEGNAPVNRLLEIFSTWRGRSGDDEFSSCNSPSRRLKLTSRTTMLLNISSDGSSLESKLYDRLSRDKLVSSLRDDEMHPCRPLEASNSSVTAPSSPQMIPSQVQQSVLFCHDAARPPSCDSLVRNWRRERLSLSVHEPTGEMKVNSSNTRTGPKKFMQNLLVLLLHEKCGIGFMVCISWKL
ncbi:uncharacterized protein [Oryza sativa Japonica Group]|jgi:hypothetical protein|nr:uncharacterized protein LOC112937935 [Oryza sativa Japonica Group]XP_025878995.1 uncharacterized protein LOC112937935 [Oryza sativa Japonica Group]XP_025878996.1 uncharacterized protein LOC112937935 [Oryza sativa Japonica Group]XP_025878997.1 uncharacterized protein LOC112937935 [Oryza sativa Japonica Group]XP_025878998.1 uncharacterized protein LOC112937935 [Oryza sativa Japonica Group]XP_025878999.1 uncharacterized protein LOC112937935 [Oryza sativa Japonica Group]XP_025879000.1 uncharac